MAVFRVVLWKKQPEICPLYFYCLLDIDSINLPVLRFHIFCNRSHIFHRLNQYTDSYNVNFQIRFSKMAIRECTEKSIEFYCCHIHKILPDCQAHADAQRAAAVVSPFTSWRSVTSIVPVAIKPIPFITCAPSLDTSALPLPAIWVR